MKSAVRVRQHRAEEASFARSVQRDCVILVLLPPLIIATTTFWESYDVVGISLQVVEALLAGMLFLDAGRALRHNSPLISSGVDPM